ncbi:BON domain-containing protein [Rhodoferax lacus]|uniref:BON domain-containing protein n=1 Tax=Rhodoferax lacus TaxID=2184758 RepID=UPI0013143E69|nr:BON domain-containing protein [Rhodoferax lacus]
MATKSPRKISKHLRTPWPYRPLGPVWHFAALALLLCASGCTTVLSESAKRAAESRNSSDFITDAQIGTSLFSALAQKDTALAMDVNIDVWEQRVLLTGTVADARTRNEVAQSVRADKRVLKVYDEIQIVSAEELARRRASVAKRDANKKEGLERFASDYWIETKITGQLLSTRDVSSVNLRWRSVRNTVYVLGRAQSADEHRKAMEAIRAVDGVAQLKSFVEIKKYP